MPTRRLSGRWHVLTRSRSGSRSYDEVFPPRTPRTVRTARTSSIEPASSCVERATRPTERFRNRVDSLNEGPSEEQDGHRTQTEPGPKPDWIAEVAKKLGGLELEAAGTASEHIAADRDCCLEYLDGVEEEDGDEGGNGNRDRDR